MSACNKPDCIHYEVCREWQSLGNENYINESNGNCDLYQQFPESNKNGLKYVRAEQEPKTGHWITEHPLDYFQPDEYKCSECGHYYHKKVNECPNCFAKMAESQESEE